MIYLITQEQHDTQLNDTILFFLITSNMFTV